MDVSLVDIIGVKRDWETHHRVRALAIDAGSDAIKGMRDLQKRHTDDYGKLLRVLKAVASNDRVLNPHHSSKVSFTRKCTKYGLGMCASFSSIHRTRRRL